MTESKKDILGVIVVVLVLIVIPPILDAMGVDWALDVANVVVGLTVVLAAIFVRSRFR